MPKDRKPGAPAGGAGKKKATAVTAADTSSRAAATAPPDWPPFRPSLPVADLSLDVIVPDKVVVARNFFPRSLCADYVSFCRGSLDLATTPSRPKRGDAVRQNDRFQVHDPAFAARLWVQTGLREALLAHEGTATGLWGGDIVGLSPNIRVYRYSKGQLFAPHYDDSNNVTVAKEDDPSTPIAAKTTWTLLLYLTSAADGCEGGETVFYPRDRVSAKEEIAVAPETGLLLLHKHGDDCMLHEGREVRGGEKWVLRTDLCVRK